MKAYGPVRQCIEEMTSLIPIWWHGWAARRWCVGCDSRNSSGSTTKYVLERYDQLSLLMGEEWIGLNCVNWEIFGQWPYCKLFGYDMEHRIVEMVSTELAYAVSWSQYEKERQANCYHWNHRRWLSISHSLSDMTGNIRDINELEAPTFSNITAEVFMQLLIKIYRECVAQQAILTGLQCASRMAMPHTDI